jgi:S1-C subfamily serine protease
VPTLARAFAAVVRPALGFRCLGHIVVLYGFLVMSASGHPGMGLHAFPAPGPMWSTLAFVEALALVGWLVQINFAVGEVTRRPAPFADGDVLRGLLPGGGVPVSQVLNAAHQQFEGVGDEPDDEALRVYKAWHILLGVSLSLATLQLVLGALRVPSPPAVLGAFWVLEAVFGIAMEGVGLVIISRLDTSLRELRTALLVRSILSPEPAALVVDEVVPLVTQESEAAALTQVRALRPSARFEREARAQAGAAVEGSTALARHAATVASRAAGWAGRSARRFLQKADPEEWRVAFVTATVLLGLDGLTVWVALRGSVPFAGALRNAAVATAAVAALVVVLPRLRLLRILAAVALCAAWLAPHTRDDHSTLEVAVFLGLVLAGTSLRRSTGVISKILLGATSILTVTAAGLTVWSENHGDDLLAPALMRQQGTLSGTPLTQLAGSENLFQAPLPREDWYQLTPAGTVRAERQMRALFRTPAKGGEQTAKGKDDQRPSSDEPKVTRDKAAMTVIAAEKRTLADLPLVSPRNHVFLRVRVDNVPGLVERGLKEMTARLAEAARKAGVTVNDSALDQTFFDDARLLDVAARVGGRELVGVDAFLVLGDRLAEVTAWGPAASFRQQRDSILQSIAGLTLAISPAPLLSAAVTQQVMDSTVLIMGSEAMGSGFIVATSDGDAWIVTNHHVIESREEAPVWDVVFSGDGGKGAVRATVEDFDKEVDLALLRAPAPPSAKPLPIRRALPVQAGTPVFAVGFPEGLQTTTYDWYPAPTVNAGRLLAQPEMPQELREAILPFYAGINPGNSGGPVVDAEGAVLGVSVAHVPGSELSLAVPSESVLHLLHRRHADLAGKPVDAPPPRDAMLPPDPPHDALSQAQDAVVVVTAQDGTDELSGPGLLISGPSQQLLVATPYETLHKQPGHAARNVEVTFFPGTPRAATRQATLIRSSVPDNTSLLAVQPFPEAPAPVAIARIDGLQASSPVTVLGLKLDGSRKLDRKKTHVVTRRAQISGIGLGEDRRPLFFRIDAGPNHGYAGGPVLDSQGGLIGLVATTEAGSNLMQAESIAHVRNAMDGVIRSTTLTYVFNGGDLHLQLRFELDDPLHTITSVGVAEDVLDGDGTQAADELDFAFGPELGVSPPSEDNQARISVTLARPNRTFVGLQPWTENSQGRRLEEQLYFEPRMTGAMPAVELFRASQVVTDLPDSSPGMEADFTPPPSVRTCGVESRGDCKRACFARKDAGACLASAIVNGNEDIGFSRKGVAWNGAAAGSAEKRLIRAADRDGEAAVEEACRLHDSTGCVLAGLRHEHQGHKSRAASEFEQSCRDGSARGCHELARTRFADESYGQDAPETIRAAEQGCRLMNPDSCKDFGLLLERRDRWVEAIKPLTMACERHDGEACYNLGRRYGEGKVVPPDLSYSVRLIQRACLSNIGAACREVGQARLSGRGVVRGVPEALVFLKLGCELGDRASCARALDLADPLWRRRELIRALGGISAIGGGDPYSGLPDYGGDPWASPYPWGSGYGWSPF